MIRRHTMIILALALAAGLASAADAAGSKGKGGKDKEPEKPPPPSDKIEGPARVIDASNLKIGDARIRLFGVDAPQLDTYCTRDGKPWACGQDSARALAQLIGGRQVSCK